MLNRYARIIVVVVVCCCLFAGSTQALVLGAVPINQGEGQALSVSDASSATALAQIQGGGSGSKAIEVVGFLCLIVVIGTAVVVAAS